MAGQFAGKTGRRTGQTTRQGSRLLQDKPVRTPAILNPGLQLRRAIGNHGAQSLSEFGELPVSHPNDRDEREAQHVADRIMAMPEPVMQRRTDGAGGEPARSAMQNRPLSPKSGGRGRPLPPASRSYFEPRFGLDFSSVRVHADGDAAASTRAVNAHAFTIGRDVYFAHGRYAPETREGRHLLAHELTHVVQQSAAPSPRLQRFTAELNGDNVFLVPEPGDADRDLDRVLCSNVTDRRIAGRTRIDVTACLPSRTIEALNFPAQNCAEFVRVAMGQTPPDSPGPEWALSEKIWEELVNNGFRVRNFGLVDGQGRIEPFNTLTWKQLSPRMGDVVFMLGEIQMQQGRTEPDPKGDNFSVGFDHIGLFVVRSRDGVDYHLAKDGDLDGNPIGLYHTGMEYFENLPGAYFKGTKSLIAYLDQLSPEDVAAQERYIPRRASELFWGLPKGERSKISEETDRRFVEETGVARRLDPDSSKDQPLHWKWLRIRDEITVRHIVGSRASPRR